MRILRFVLRLSMAVAILTGALLNNTLTLHKDRVVPYHRQKVSISDITISEPEPTLSLVMVGDILLHMQVEDAAKDKKGKYDFGFIFERMKPYFTEADIAMVNQEVILGGKELGISGYPNFNAPYEVGDALADAGFDVICHGTNHSLDRGKKGVINTLSYWKENHPGIKVVGMHDSAKSQNKICYIEKNGIKVAILNYTYGTNGIPLPSDMPYAVDYLNEARVKADLKKAEKKADFTIVCPHWGVEYNLGVSEEQKRWTKLFRKYGADLVIGTHPHVIEPIELFPDEDDLITNNHGDGDMLVYYSLGNYVNWTESTGRGIANRAIGGMAEVTLKKDASGEVFIDEYGVRGIVTHLTPGYKGVDIYPISEYSEELARENVVVKKDELFSYEYCKELCDSVWGDVWH